MKGIFIVFLSNGISNKWLSTALAKLCSVLINIFESSKMKSTFPLQFMGVFIKEMYWFLSIFSWIIVQILFFLTHDMMNILPETFTRCGIRWNYLCLGVFFSSCYHISWMPYSAFFLYCFVQALCSDVKILQWVYWYVFTGFVGAWLMTWSGVLHGTGVISRMRLTRSALLQSSSSILHVLRQLSHLEV